MINMSTTSPDSMPSTERRRTQLRESQRKHRQRQQEVGQELELRIIELQERVKQADKEKEMLQAIILKTLSALEMQRRLFLSDIPRIIESNLAAQQPCGTHVRLTVPSNGAAECHGQSNHAHRADHHLQYARRNINIRGMPHDPSTRSSPACEHSGYPESMPAPSQRKSDSSSAVVSSYFEFDESGKRGDGEICMAKSYGLALEEDEIVALQQELKSSYQLSDAEMSVFQSISTADPTHLVDCGDFAESRAGELSLHLPWDDLEGYEKPSAVDMGDEGLTMIPDNISIRNGMNVLY